MLRDRLRQAAGCAEPSRPPAGPRSRRLAGGTGSRAPRRKAEWTVVSTWWAGEQGAAGGRNSVNGGRGPPACGALVQRAEEKRAPPLQPRPGGSGSQGTQPEAEPACPAGRGSTAAPSTGGRAAPWS